MKNELMRSITLKYFCLSTIFLSTFSMAAGIRVEVLSCDNCTANQMKLAAETKPIYTFDKKFSHVFDKENLVYRKFEVYKAQSSGGEPPRKQLNAYAVPIDTAVNQKFLELAPLRANAMNFLFDKTFVLDSSGSIDSYKSFSPLSSERSFAVQYSTQAQTTSSVTCEAAEVDESAMTAHDYVNNSLNRRDLFNKLKTGISEEDPTNSVLLFTSKYSEFTTVMENSSNGIISTIGSVLGILNPNSFSLSTVDGGRLNGVMDFDQETFEITSAWDGDCNQIPLDINQASGIYEFSSGSGADRMNRLLRSFGAEGGVGQEWSPRCGAWQTVCTGVNGADFICDTICTIYD